MYTFYTLFIYNLLGDFFWKYFILSNTHVSYVMYGLTIQYIKRTNQLKLFDLVYLRFGRQRQRNKRFTTNT